MSNTIQINLHYNELKKILTNFYKSAVNSYEDLAEIKAIEAINDIISNKHLKDVSCVKFAVVGDTIQEISTPIQEISTPIQVISSNFTDNINYSYVGNTIITPDGQNLSLTFSTL
jgi:hypothetical protein